MKLTMCACVGALGFGLATAPSASADSFDVENFDPISPGDATLFGVQSARLAAPSRLAFGASLGIADDPLVVVAAGEDDRAGELVGGRVGLDLGAAWGFGQFEVAARLPLVLDQSSNTVPNANFDTAETGGIGDAKLSARARLIGDGDRGVSVAAGLGVSVPTAAGAEFAGDGSPAASPVAIAEWRNGRVALAANVGGRLRPSDTVGDLEIGSAFTYGVGVAVSPRADWSVIAELDGELAGGRMEQAPLEARTGLRWHSASGVAVGAGYGRGLIYGYGAPDHRGLVTVGYRAEPTKAPPIRVAHVDPPIAAAPPPPPPNPDPDGDGVLGADDLCPGEAEDMDDYRDEDGCPEADNDGDGIADADDACPQKAEIINGIDDDDGCPDEGEQLVEIGKTRLVIKTQIHFAHDRDVILPTSEPLLYQLAKTMERNPWIRLVRIEGHTDKRGDDEYNLDLSRRRAESVQRALTERGVAAQRLETAGLGEAHPIDTNETSVGRANNRRVEFHIVEQDETRPAPEIDEGGSR